MLSTHCKEIRNREMLKMRYCGSELFKLGKKHDGKWFCPMCGHENAGDTEICEVCGAYKEEPAYDAIADEEDHED